MIDYLLNNSDFDVFYFLVVTGLIGVMGGYSFLKYDMFKGVVRFLTVFLCIVGVAFGGFLSMIGLSIPVSIFGGLVVGLCVSGLMRLLRFTA